jgi:anti-sigma regulatory factor (Ser/Thr protein kinase)
VAHPGAATIRSPHSTSRAANEISLGLAAEPRSCALARRAVQAFCRTQRLPHLAEDAALLTSELVGNAVEHSTGTITLVARCSRGAVTVRVRDDHARAASAPDALREHEADRVRRLFVVSRLAGQWGTSHQDEGQCVWFRLP